MNRDAYTTEQLIRNIVKIVLYTFAMLLNSWLLVILWRDPMKRFRNSPSYIIANLALADIVAAIGGLCQTTAIFTCSQCLRTHDLLSCIQTLGLQCSFLFTTLLAFDRFFALSHPYIYKTFAQKYHIALLCIVAWVIGSVLSPMVYYVELDSKHGKDIVLYQLYMIDIIVLALLTAVLYPMNYYNYLKKKHRLYASTHTSQSIEDHRLAQQLNVSWMITATVLFTSMTPYIFPLVYTLKNCYECFLDETYQKFWVNYQAVIPFILLVNPIIYAWRLPLYRKSLVVLAKSFVEVLTMKNWSQTPINSSDNVSRTGSTTVANDVGL